MVRPEPHPSGWRRSSRCESNACVEVALWPDSVAVRDNTLPHRHLTFDEASWRSLVRDIQSGRLSA